MRARFCPICGGFSQWTPRLVEALYYECVPVILSDALLPPFSRILDWTKFSARLPANQLHRLKPFVKSLDYPSLIASVRRARAALMYNLGVYRGDDLLPLLMFEMARKAVVPILPVMPKVRHTELESREFNASLIAELMLHAY